MSTLTHPRDLDAWRRWQEQQHPVRALAGLIRRRPTRAIVTQSNVDADLLVAVDAVTPSHAAALLRPLVNLDPDRIIVLSSSSVAQHLPEPAPRHSWTERPWRAGEPVSPLSGVLAAGHFLELGGAAHRIALAHRVPYFVVQHGLITPSQPPLPAGCTVLTWSEADGAFWRSGRADVATQVVGSQLFHDAAAAPARHFDATAPPTYLGQLHGAELPRRAMAAAAENFCRATGATYRPHPSERDRVSRRYHARWRSDGVRIDDGGGPLAEVGTPVVSVFSTGVLEAAARGIPAYVVFPDPPAWLSEFWERYDMRPWGGEPTPSPIGDVSGQSPAELVAQALVNAG